MKKLMPLISISMIFAAAQQAVAIFVPEDSPKAHTRCFEPNLRDAGVQVLLTNVKSGDQEPRVRADVYEISIRGSEKIAVRNTAPVESENSRIYVGNDFSLTVSNVPPANEVLRTGKLVMILQNGQKLVKTLKCDGIMRVLSGGI